MLGLLSWGCLEPVKPKIILIALGKEIDVSKLAGIATNGQVLWRV